jgi:hypothetical protein
MKSEILLQRVSIGEVSVCVCENRRGTKGDLCLNCGGAIPNSVEQLQVDDLIARINRPERIVCPACGGGDPYCLKCMGSGKVNK